MELVDTPEQAGFRAGLRAWLDRVVPEIDQPTTWETPEAVVTWRAWQRLLFDQGYAGLTWPREHGGGGADAILASIYREELDRAGAPASLNILGENLAGPSIIAFGTEPQKARYLRAILDGTDIWCQLFSEPEAGSDLASLRTRATRVDGGWRVQGQKIWTSRAHLASYGIMLARTGTEPRHKGITYFLVPMDSEGIRVLPLPHMLGSAEFNEVFFDDVFLPDDAVLGEVDGGWTVAMATLAFERVAIATGRVNTRKAVADIVSDVAGMTDGAGAPLGGSPAVRQKIADLYGRALVHYLIGQRVAADVADGSPPGPVASIGKLYFCPLVDELADFRLSLEPLGGQVGLEADEQHAESWLRLAYQSRGTAIAGGSTFIQRNIVAERLLGMPRG